MRKEQVEIYSDETNLAVMRLPGRHFPGSLIQGDTLKGLCELSDEVCSAMKGDNKEEAYKKMNELRNRLWERMNHFNMVLNEHNLPRPFSEPPYKT